MTLFVPSDHRDRATDRRCSRVVQQPQRFKKLWQLVLVVLGLGASFALALTETEANPLQAPTHSGVPRSRSARPLADPVVNADAVFKASRATAWNQGQTRILLLDRQVSVSVGTYGFRADRAVVRIDKERRPGGDIHHLAIYLDNARALEGQGPVQAQAPRLLVTVSTTGKIQLSTDLLARQADAPNDPLVDQATRRIERYLAVISANPLNVPDGPALFSDEAMAMRQARRQQIAQDTIRETTTRQGAVQAKTATTMGSPPEPSLANIPARRILPGTGVVSFHADKIVFEENSETESTISLLGNVRVVYQNQSQRQGMILRAENAVIFVANSALAGVAGRQTDASHVHGVYLEDNVVATDGQYTVRAPRVFYDLTQNKAVVLDAVFYTWDVRHHVPVYVRAQRLRQASLTHWTAQRAALTTSEFAEPHFSIASSQLSFHRERATDGSDGYQFTAQNSTLRWGKAPVFYWPYLSGNVQTIRQTPLPRVSAGFSRQDGPIIRTAWNLFAATGRPQPEGVSLLGRVDYLGDRGPALGVNLDYDLPRFSGFLDGYVVGQDHGEDKIGGRRDIAFDGDTRGYLLWRHRQRLRNDWDLSLEISQVSDETFLEEFFLPEAELSKPYENSIYLKKQEQDLAFTFLAQYDSIGFTPQTTILQSQGYTVEKQPELGYYRIGTSLWGDRLTYSSQTRLSRMRIRAGKDTPSRRGLTSLQSRLLLGIPNTTSFENAIAAAGISSDYRLRFDSRHEIQSPLKAGIFDVVPYAVGRVTLYDDDFAEFSGEDDNTRLWSTLGVRVHAQVNKIFEDVEDAVLDLHRLRHVIEPRLDVFWSGSTINPGDLPLYDSDVEGLQEGFGIRIGARNTLQTQRGGIGRWRNVDWLVLNTDLVLRSDDTDVNTDIARFFSYRPEYSLGGDHFHSDLMWMISDTLAAIAEITQNLEANHTAQWRLGMSFQHTPRLSFFTDYSEIDLLTSRLFTYGFSYQLTRKYHLGFRHTLDLGVNDSRSIALSLQRKLPHWRILIIARVDEIDNEVTLGVVLTPQGLKSSRPIQVMDSRPGR